MFSLLRKKIHYWMSVTRLLSFHCNLTETYVSQKFRILFRLHTTFDNMFINELAVININILSNILIRSSFLFKINRFKYMYTKQSQSLRMQKKRPCYFSFVFRQQTLFPSYLVISQLRHQTLKTNQSQSQKTDIKTSIE